MSSVGIIILAAGAAERMGRPKQLLAFRGKSLLRRAAEAARAAPCARVVVVLGAHAEQARAELNGLPVEAVENKDWIDGIGSSLRTGIAALESDGDIQAAAIMLCDQPFVSAAHIEKLVVEYRRGCSRIVASEYAGILGVPALFDRSLFADLRTVSGTSGAKRILDERANEAARVTFASGAIDVDTPEDFERLCHAQT